MRLFIFARHAESAANTARLLNSDPAHQVDLTRHGQQQARLLGEQLAHPQIDQAVCTRLPAHATNDRARPREPRHPAAR
jgi:broad specificity phosphatase PhoE